MDESLETGLSGPANSSESADIEKLFSEARHRWLSTTEICDILQNYKKLQIASEPPNKPPSGVLLLFDRRVVRNFRKDGYKWRMKKEGHKKLKIEGIEALHCYYNRGEENENFRRHCYSMIEKDFSDIVLVHYLEKKGKGEDFSCVKEVQVAGSYSQGQECVEIMPNSNHDSSMCPGSHPNNCQVLSVSECTDTASLPNECTDTASLQNGAQALEPENAQSAIPTVDLAPTQSDQGKSDNDAEWSTYFNFDGCASHTPCSESIECGSFSSFSHPDTIDKFLSNSFARGLHFGVRSQIHEESAGKMEDSSCVKETQGAGPYSQETKDIMPNAEIHGSMRFSSHLSNCHVTDNTASEREKSVDIEYNHPPSSGLHSGLEPRQPAVENNDAGSSDPYVPLSSQNSFHKILSGVACIDLSLSQLDKGKSDNDAELAHERQTNPYSPSWQYIFDTCTRSIQDMSSSSSHPDIVGKFFSNGVVKRQDFGDSQIQKELKALVEDSSSLSKKPMVQKLHSDSDAWFKSWRKSPYAPVIEDLFDGSLTEEGSKSRSSSGANGETGENENENDVSSIPSEGKLDIHDINAAENYSDSAGAKLLQRFDNLLWSGSSATNSVTSSLEDASQLSSKISSLLKGDNKEFDQMLKSGLGIEFSLEKFKDQLLQELLKEKLCSWILQKDAEGGNGPAVLDEVGQGVLHLEAALGYDWALKPTILAGVNVDFRDVNGWTALQWAASCGRERAVASLIWLGAAPGALTNQSPKYPAGSTPTDLATVKGHKEIARYLTDCFSDVHIPSINLDHQVDAAGPKAIQKISEISAAPVSLGNASDGQSRKDSSATICFPITEIIVLDRGFKKIVFRPNHMCQKCKKKSMTKLSGVRGIDSISIDLKEQKLTVIGEFDPEDIIKKIRNLKNEGPDEDDDEDEDEEEEEEEDKAPDEKKEEGKKRAPDPALESGKACKILKAYLASMALLTAYYYVQSMKAIQILVLVFDEASKKPGERKLSYIDDGFELSAIRL